MRPAFRAPSLRALGVYPIRAIKEGKTLESEIGNTAPPRRKQQG